MVKKKKQNSIFSRVYYATGSSEANISHHLLKELSKIFQMHVNILSKRWLIFCCYLQKIQQMSNFWHSVNTNSRSKHDKWTNKWPHFFHLLLELYLLVYFNFEFQDLQNSIPWVFPHFLEIQSLLVCIIFWSVRYTCTNQKWHF